MVLAALTHARGIMRAFLSHGDELVVRNACARDAVTLWRVLHDLYVSRRGADPRCDISDPVPATTYRDVIEVVNAFEGVAGAIRTNAVRGLDHWRRGYTQTFELIARAPDLDELFPHNDVVWLELTRPLAAQLVTSAPRPDRDRARV